jgi:hypothetical protein
MSAASIVNELEDKYIWGTHFSDDSWLPWKCFLRVLHGEKLSQDQLALYTKCTGRTVPPTKPFTEAALIVGRRGGKSRILALNAVHLATCRDYSPFLAAGEVATVAVLAANRDQARSIFRYISGFFKSVPLLSPLVQDEKAESIILKNRVVIEVATASFRTTRGYSFCAVLADEIAFWRQDESSANPDVEILRALRPGLSTIPGSMLLLASSPYAKRGELYSAYRRHFGNDNGRVLVWKAPTEVMNPRVDAKIIAEAYESDPEAAKAEYGAEFREDLADYITREAVDAVTMFGRHELPPIPGITYSAFCDPSGGLADSMCLAIAHMDGNTAILDALLEVRPPFDPTHAVAECVNLLRRFNITSLTSDKYAGNWPVARFREQGIELTQSARPKSDIYHDFLPLISAGRIELLDNKRLASQLASLERRVARSGRDSIDHSPGGHDDLANVTAGVLVGLDLDRRPALVKKDNVLIEGKGVPLPKLCDYVFGVIELADDGTSVVIFAAIHHYIKGAAPLIILDYDVTNLASGFFKHAAERLHELYIQCHAYNGSLGFFIREDLFPQVINAGIPDHLVQKIPSTILDVDAQKIGAAVHIADGKVKITDLVEDKGRTSTIGAALDFKPGADLKDDPLRAAVVHTIVIALNQC